MPINASTPVCGHAAAIAPKMSPSLMSLMRQPAARISPIRSTCRGRSSTTMVNSPRVLCLARAIESRLWRTDLVMSTAPRASGPTAILFMYTNGPGLNIEPRSATAITLSALPRPSEVSVVPSIGSTATSVTGLLPLPTCSPLKSIGASSFSPSPITTMPSMLTVSSRLRIASTAAPSAAFLSPRPTHFDAARAADSVTRTSSIARLRSGFLESGTAPKIAETCGD